MVEESLYYINLKGSIKKNILIKYTALYIYKKIGWPRKYNA